MDTSKKIVHYNPCAGLVIAVGFPAYVYPIDHSGPFVSNTTLCRTTKVLQYDVDTGEFETLNSIYKLPK